MNVSADSGKVEVILQKLQVDSQWATIGKYLDRHNQTVKYSEYSKLKLTGKVSLIFNDTNFFFPLFQFPVVYGFLLYKGSLFRVVRYQIVL